MPRQPSLSDAARALGRKGGRIGGRTRGPTKSRVASPRFRPLTDEARAKGLHVRRVKAARKMLAAWKVPVPSFESSNGLRAAREWIADQWGHDVLAEAEREE